MQRDRCKSDAFDWLHSQWNHRCIHSLSAYAQRENSNVSIQRPVSEIYSPLEAPRTVQAG